MPDQDFNPSSEDIANYLKSRSKQPNAFQQLAPSMGALLAPGLVKGAAALAGKVSPMLSALFLLKKPPSPRSVGDLYHILNERSEKVGSLSASYVPDYKRLDVHSLSSNISSPLSEGNQARDLNPLAHSLGTNNIRSLVDALKGQYPEAETIRAFRSSGSRPDMTRDLRIRPSTDPASGEGNFSLGNESQLLDSNVGLPNSHQVEDLKDTITSIFPEGKFRPRQHANPYVAYYLNDEGNGPTFSRGFVLRNKPDNGPHVLIDKSAGAITHNIPGFDFPSHVNDILSGY